MNKLMMEFPPQQIHEIRTAAIEIATSVNRFKDIVQAVTEMSTSDLADVADFLKARRLARLAAVKMQNDLRRQRAKLAKKKARSRR